jgi:uncharacterized membrane protein
MQSRLRIAGHGMQPLLLMFPLGLFWTAFVLDLATLLGAPAMLGTAAFWNLVAGLGGGLLATLAAVADAVAATGPAGTRIFVLALLLDVGVLISYAVLTLMRVREPDRTTSASLLTIEVTGLAAAAFSAWFSGRLAAPGAPIADPRRPTDSPHRPSATPTTLNQLLTNPPPPGPRPAPSPPPAPAPHPRRPTVSPRPAPSPRRNPSPRPAAPPRAGNAESRPTPAPRQTGSDARLAAVPPRAH